VKIKELLLATLICLIQSTNLASSQLAEIDKINKDVWLPLIQSYKFNDGELINSVHEANALAINIDANRIHLAKDLFKKRIDVFNRWKEQKRKQDFSLSFQNRIVMASGPMM